MATTIDSLETVFKALADKTRLRILALLGSDEVCVCHLHDTLGVPQPTVSRHLAYLRRTKLVDARRDDATRSHQGVVRCNEGQATRRKRRRRALRPEL